MVKAQQCCWPPPLTILESTQNQSIHFDAFLKIIHKNNTYLLHKRLKNEVSFSQQICDQK
jgi:hypothetical protein